MWMGLQNGQVAIDKTMGSTKYTVINRLNSLDYDIICPPVAVLPKQVIHRAFLKRSPERSPKEISNKVGLTLGDFSVGIRVLKKCDLIRKFTKKEYMLNPDVMFNGNDKQYFIIKHMWDTQTSKGLRT